MFLKTCCPLWHRILTNNFYTPCTTLPSSPQTHFNVSFIPSCILMELYTGELLFGTHENLEHLALMDGLFWFHSGWKVCAIETPSKPQHDRWWFQTFFYFHDISCLFGEDSHFDEHQRTKQKTLWSTARRQVWEDSLLRCCPKRPANPGTSARSWRFEDFEGKELDTGWQKKSEAYEIPVFWSLRLLWLLQKNLQSWVRYLARDRHGGWKLNWL